MMIAIRKDWPALTFSGLFGHCSNNKEVDQGE